MMRHTLAWNDLFKLAGVETRSTRQDINSTLFLCRYRNAQIATIMQINIGKIIRDELRSQGYTNQWLADQLCIDRSTVQRLFNKPSIDTQQLFRISKILGKDLFKHYSDMLTM